MVPDAKPDLSQLEFGCIVPPQKIHLHVVDYTACLESITSILVSSKPTLWNPGQFLQNGTAGQVHAINLKALCNREWLDFWSFMQCSVFLKNKMSI